MVSMDITPYVERLRTDLQHSAATTDPATQAAAERLALGLRRCGHDEGDLSLR